MKKIFKTGREEINLLKSFLINLKLLIFSYFISLLSVVFIFSISFIIRQKHLSNDEFLKRGFIGFIFFSTILTIVWLVRCWSEAKVNVIFENGEITVKNRLPFLKDEKIKYSQVTYAIVKFGEVVELRYDTWGSIVFLFFDEDKINEFTSFLKNEINHVDFRYLNTGLRGFKGKLK